MSFNAYHQYSFSFKSPDASPIPTLSTARKREVAHMRYFVYDLTDKRSDMILTSSASNAPSMPNKEFTL